MDHVGAFLGAYDQQDRANILPVAVKQFWARLRTLRGRAVDQLRSHFRAAALAAGADRDFLNRYSADLAAPPRGAYQGKQLKRRKADREDRQQGFVHAALRACVAAHLQIPERDDQARLCKLAALVEPFERQFSEAVHNLPQLLSLDEEISACNAARAQLEEENRRKFIRQQQENDVWRAAQAKNKQKKREEARKAHTVNRLIPKLKIEKTFAGEADWRSRRVLANFIGVQLVTGLDGPQYAFSAWCAQVGETLGTGGDAFVQQAHEQLWEHVEILDIKDGKVTAHVDHSPFVTTINMPPRMPPQRTTTLAGFFAMFGKTTCHYALDEVNFARMHVVARALQAPEFTRLPNTQHRHMKHMLDYNARVQRLKTLPWHYLKKRKR